jgi:hypothetical protein
MFTAPISSNHHNKNSNSLHEKENASDTNETSGQSVQAKNVNSNATGTRPAFTVVLQITTEKEKFAVITKAGLHR